MNQIEQAQQELMKMRERVAESMQATTPEEMLAIAMNLLEEAFVINRVKQPTGFVPTSPVQQQRSDGPENYS